MKRKLISVMIVLAVTFSFIPLGTADVNAASDGSKMLVKTKTVSIKPGKTYKAPVFKLSKKMVIQVPVEVWLSPKDKGKPKDYIKKGSIKITLNTAKGKKIDTFTGSLKNVDRREGYWIDEWVYWYSSKKVTNPGFAKGKYYFTFKNTTDRIIKVKYAVKGYTKYASTADLPEEITLNGDGVDFPFNPKPFYVGKIGPGLPLVKSVKSNNADIDVSFWYVTADGSLYIIPYGKGTATVTVKLTNGKKAYKIKLTAVQEIDDDEEYDDE